MKITAMDKAACRAINAAVEQALGQVGRDLGLSVKVGGGKFDPTGGTFNPKVEFAVPVVGGVDRERAEWNRHCASFGLEPGDYGKEFDSRGKPYRLVGFELKRSKFPFRAVGPDLKVMLFTYQCLRTVNAKAYESNKPWTPGEAKIVPIRDVLLVHTHPGAGAGRYDSDCPACANPVVAR